MIIIMPVTYWVILIIANIFFACFVCRQSKTLSVTVRLCLPLPGGSRGPSPLWGSGGNAPEHACDEILHNEMYQVKIYGRGRCFIETVSCHLTIGEQLQLGLTGIQQKS